jgi:hypothetical protein
MSEPAQLFADVPLAPAGNANRFGARWRLSGAGLSNVWRFGDLELATPSGRLLLRGPNGTGKTTALEALWPYLLDLNGSRLAAGKGRTTTPAMLMREGADGKRRYGYAWLTFTAPGDVREHSYGVRLQYSPSASTQIKVVPFVVPGRPLQILRLHGPARAGLTLEQFTAEVERASGQVFDDEASYVAQLAAEVWHATASELGELASRLRSVRDPSLLAAVTPRVAAEALRASLPGVSEEVIAATADALGESEATREAFDRDREAAAVLRAFAEVWAAHAAAVVATAAETARDANAHADRAQRARSAAQHAATRAQDRERRAASRVEGLETELAGVQGEVEALKASEAYQESERLDELRTTLEAHNGTAVAKLHALVAQAGEAAERSRRLSESAEALDADLSEAVQTAVDADARARPDVALLSIVLRPRVALSVGATSANPGPVVEITADPARLDALSKHWRTLGTGQQRRAETAELIASDHRHVAVADHAADVAEREAAAAAARADAAGESARTAAEAAQVAADALLATLESWSSANADLASGCSEPWEAADVTELAADETAAVLAAADAWAEAATTHAAQERAARRQQAQETRTQAEARDVQAEDLREQAETLKSGELLPFPRPGWSQATDDAFAFGAALEWEHGFDEHAARARLELALSHSGLLGALLSDAGAVTDDWVVVPEGPRPQESLRSAIRADPEHPLAAIADQVLARIALEPTATRATGAWLIVGRDGSFRAGVLVGAPDQPPPEPQFVGARQRRQAALARARELELAAAVLADEGRELRARAGGLDALAAAIAERAARFPDRGALRRAETARVGAAAEAIRTGALADAAQGQARARRAEHERLRSAWIGRCHALRLPADADELAELAREARRAQKELTRAATALERRRSRLETLRLDAAEDTASTAALAELEQAARAAGRTAATSTAKVRTITASAGGAIQDVLKALTDAGGRADSLGTRLARARDELQEAGKAQSRAATRLETAEVERSDALPRSAAARRELDGVLAIDGVAEAIGLRMATAAAEPAEVIAALDGRERVPRRRVLERYDAARAPLAGVWTIDPGDAHGELDTYVLTHQDETYTPPQAADRAHALAERAERALAAAEEAALRDFVVGRLPNAIGTAWTHLRDWTGEVNAKMRSVAASSGVSVQVRTRVSAGLSPAAMVVHELSCLRGEADRTTAEQAQLREALEALIAASGGETTAERIADAVDIRQWIDLDYMVSRRDGPPQRWGTRTGLSSGERRLVILAPMLAAVAATHDRLAADGLRLVGLDEIPAEVDERGRAGLARYVAELDLDLICTSHLWDGSPGAWDGIDAFELEAGDDGTVVGFPMLIRGLQPLPGDPM